jgi:cell division protein FtsB
VKALTLIFVILIALIQYPLWLGKGSWLRVWDLNRQIADQQEKNNGLKARNETLDAEVLDLKSGRAAIEERARSELGMVKQDEVFYQVLENAGIKNAVPKNKVLENTTTTINAPTILEPPASPEIKTPLKSAKK